MTGADIQEKAFADFNLWISMQDEVIQDLSGEDQAELYAADIAWHEAVRECELMEGSGGG